MLAPKILATGIAMLLVIISAAVLRKQAHAKECPVHNRFAGWLATVIGWALLALSLALIVLVWTLW